METERPKETKETVETTGDMYICMERQRETEGDYRDCRDCGDEIYIQIQNCMER